MVVSKGLLVQVQQVLIILFDHRMPEKQLIEKLTIFRGLNLFDKKSFRFFSILCILRFVTPRFIPKPDLSPLFWPWKCYKSGMWRILENKLCEFIRNNRHFLENFVILPTDFVDYTKCFSIFCIFFKFWKGFHKFERI